MPKSYDAGFVQVILKRSRCIVSNGTDKDEYFRVDTWLVADMLHPDRCRFTHTVSNSSAVRSTGVLIVSMHTT